ncbi:Protein ZINC INDUCED FACILITATOR-LIKE 1 [Durusdinium trenchii]|uniref:Protein ZINC INDUCED FACILITATOR-LIKE 1 n=1 Tax=Durusdinium trenchii TaxID=1381693 RepID=A0ABP0JNT6_9DINO
MVLRDVKWLDEGDIDFLLALGESNGSGPEQIDLQAIPLSGFLTKVQTLRDRWATAPVTLADLVLATRPTWLYPWEIKKAFAQWSSEQAHDEMLTLAELRVYARFAEKISYEGLIGDPEPQPEMPDRALKFFQLHAESGKSTMMLKLMTNEMGILMDEQLRNYFYSKNTFKDGKGLRRSATIGVENFIAAADGRTPLRARALRGARTRREMAGAG